MTRQSYPPEIRIIRVMCTGRVDPAFVLRAFEKGADGVAVSGCWPGECHYVTEGNYGALATVLLLQRLLDRVGVAPERLHLAWVSAAEGTRFAEIMTGFVGRLRELGPLGRGEGIAAGDLALRLEALSRIVPFMKLVEREKLRVPERSEEAYRAFYASEEVTRIVDEVLLERLAMCQTLLLLREKPANAREIADRLGLQPSDVSRHLSESSRQGLVTYDVEEKRYALAGAR